MQTNSQSPYMPLLNSTFPSLPPLSQNCFSRDIADTACFWGKAARARGRAKIEVVRIKPASVLVIGFYGKQCCIPRFTGSVILGLRFSHSVCCNRTRTRGGSTIIGVELSTLLSAVSPTASVAAFLLFPRLCTWDPSFSFCAFSSSLKVGKTSIPCRISSPRIRNTLRAPAEATAANGTNRVRVVLAVGDRRLRRGTIALRPSATEQEAETAKRYDFAIVDVERGVDLLALALLMPTLRDWLVICHRSVPVVCDRSAVFWDETEGSCTWRPGVSIPAVTMRLEMTKQDMRKGRKTDCPVSKLSAGEDGCDGVASYLGAAWSPLSSLPSIFLGSLTSPDPACMMRRASSHVQGLKRRQKVFCMPERSITCRALGADSGIPTAPASGEAVPNFSSPGIRYLGGLLHTAPVATEVILRGGEVATSGEGGRHGSREAWWKLKDAQKNILGYSTHR